MTRAPCLIPRNTLRTSTANVRSQSLDARLGDRPERAADAGVVEQDVEPAEALDGGADQRLDVVLLGDVGAQEQQPVRVGDLVDEALAVVGVEVADDDAGALGEEAQHRRPADAAGTTGDDGDPVGEHV